MSEAISTNFDYLKLINLLLREAKNMSTVYNRVHFCTGKMPKNSSVTNPGAILGKKSGYKNGNVI